MVSALIIIGLICCVAAFAWSIVDDLSDGHDQG